MSSNRSLFQLGNSSVNSEMDDSVSTTFGGAQQNAQKKESMFGSHHPEERKTEPSVRPSNDHNKDEHGKTKKQQQQQQFTNNLQYVPYNWNKNNPVEVTDADADVSKPSADSLKNDVVKPKLKPDDGNKLRGSAFHQVYRYIAKRIGIYNYETHKFKSNEYLISLQSMEHKDQEYLFFYVVNDQLELLKQKLEQIRASELLESNLERIDENDLEQPGDSKQSDEPLADAAFRDAVIRECTDAVGANIIHVAYLLKQYKIGRYLVEQYPDAALEGYSNSSTCTYITHDQMPYTGENILQIAIVHKNHTEVRWLLDFYRDRKHSLPCGNKDGNRHGLKMLLDAKATGTFFTGKVGDPMANRGFFSSENSYYQNEHYFGQTPLHFAACTNDTDLFDLVLTYVTSEYPDALFRRDSHGNNLLHIAVIRNLTKMFRHIKRKAEESLKLRIRDAYTRHLLKDTKEDHFPFNEVLLIPTDKNIAHEGYDHKISMIKVAPGLEKIILEQVPDKMAELLMHALNDDGHTPRTLAAEKGNKEMLEFLVEEYMDFMWSYGPLSVSRINLDGLERPVERELYTSRIHKPLYSAIEWLCMGKHYNCIKIPLIQQIIKVKWTRIGLPILRSEALLSFLITTLVTLILVLGTNPPSIHNHNSRQLFVTCLYGTSCGLFLYRYIREIPLVIDMLKFNYRYTAFLGGLRGSPVIDEICVHVSSFAFLVLCYAQASSPRSTDVIMTISTATLLGQELYYAQVVQYSLVICVLFSWFHVYYYLMVLESTGPFILILYKVISGDVPYFLGFYLIILLALGCAISLMTSATNRSSQSMPNDFFHLVQVWWTLLKVIVQFPDDFHTENILSGLDWFYDFIRTSYSVTSIILMLNLLVAMMTSTYQTYSQNSDELLLVEKYNIMCTMLRVESQTGFFSQYSHYAFEVFKQKCFRTETVPTEPLKESSTTEADPVESQKDFSSQCSNYAFEDVKWKIFENETIRTRVRKWYYKIEDYQTAWFNDSSSAPPSDIASQILHLLKDHKIINVNTFQNKLKEIRNNFENSPTIMSRTVHSSPNTNTDTASAADASSQDSSVTTATTKSRTIPTKSRTILMILDPQNDFGPNGTLEVQGSQMDAERIAKMITTHTEQIDEIYVTLDTHQYVHIGNASFWVDSATRKHPEPCTELPHDEIISGKWIPIIDGYSNYAKQYARKLKAIPLQIFVWPDHCIIGTHGHSVLPVINTALQEWVEMTHKSVHYICKGENPMTEMYSALSAAVSVYADQTTSIDMKLIGQLQIADKILVCGEALTHTVKYTLVDLCRYIDARKIYLLLDGTSPVQMHDFESVVSKLKQDLKKEGVIFSTTTEVFEDVISANINEKEDSAKNVGTHVTSREMDTEEIQRKVQEKTSSQIQELSGKMSSQMLEISEKMSSQINHKNSFEANDFNNPNLIQAYSILMDPDNAPDSAALNSYLLEIGVRIASDLEHCSKDQVSAIKSMLKSVKGRAFASKFEVAVKESSDVAVV